MAEIFISYKSERRPAARHLKKVLDCYFKNSGEDCVWYDYGLIPGDDFEPRIMAEINNAKVVIVLWCAMSVKSPWVHKEARAARHADKFLPVRIEACALPEEFAGADTINLSGWDASPSNPVLHRVLEDVGRRIGREPVSRIASLREVEEDWRGYGAPSLAAFALSKPLRADEARNERAIASASAQSILGGPPPGMTDNLRRHWEDAQRGKPHALDYIGYAFEVGEDGVAKNERKAARLYKLAADQGNPPAQTHLAYMYEDGRGGLPKDEREAARLYKLAAERGYPAAQNNLALMYENGRGVLPKDEDEAARLYKLAADRGDAFAQTKLALMYQQGRGGLPKSEREAVRLYKLAADQGDALAQSILGAMYESGWGGLAKDEREAVRLYMLAANQGDAGGQDNLGTMYEHGLGGLPKDEHTAVAYYKGAADQGDAGGRVHLGMMYAKGRGGLPKDEREAMRLYRLAARDGNEEAQEELRRRGESW
ncbi:MAG: TIR domain-containing protein [Hyphomonadaceae bacterium]